MDMALEQGRDVYVVPGRVTDRLSDGCNSLLKQGAGVFLSPEDFLQEAESAWQGRRGEACGTVQAARGTERAARRDGDGDGEGEGEREGGGDGDGEGGIAKVWGKGLDAEMPFRVKGLPAELQKVYCALELQPRSLAEIGERVGGGCPAQRLTVLLMRLCMEGVAVQLTPGHFARRV